MRWFGPFLLATAVAAAADVGVSAFVHATMASTPEPQSRSGSPQATAQTEPRHVSIDPSHIEVIGHRPAVRLGAGANTSSRRRQPS